MHSKLKKLVQSIMPLNRAELSSREIETDLPSSLDFNICARVRILLSEFDLEKVPFPTALFPTANGGMAFEWSSPEKSEYVRVDIEGNGYELNGIFVCGDEVEEFAVESEDFLVGLS